MRFVIGIIIFWICIFSLQKFVIEKTKIKEEFSLPLVFTLIGIYMYISGILNIMRIAALILVIFSISYLVYLFIKKKIKFQNIKFKSFTFLIIFLVFLYITIICQFLHLTNYDNFSHWALIIKNMFLTNSLPNFESSIVFKGYQPGSACFIYFLGLLCGKTETVMMVAHNYLIFGYLTAFIALVKDRKNFFIQILLLIFYVFVLTNSINLNSLLVDSLIAIMCLMIFLLIYNYREDLKQCVKYSLPFMIYLFLVKNIGLVLDGFICLYILYLAYKDKKLKEGIKYVFIIGVILLFVMITWDHHVSMVYGTSGLYSKHSLSKANIMTTLQGKGLNEILDFVKIYILHLFELKNNISNIYIIALNVVLLVAAKLAKNKKLIKLLLALDVMYLAYYFILGIMYIVSMPTSEAVEFAGYGRYMQSIVIVIMGLVLYAIMTQKYKSKFSFIIYGLILLCMLLPLKNEKAGLNILIGKDEYKGSSAEKIKNLSSYVPLGKENNYYIYARYFSGYLYYLTIYNFNTNNFTSVNEENFDEIVNVENKKNYLVKYDNDEIINNYINEHSLKKVNEFVYELESDVSEEE